MAEDHTTAADAEAMAKAEARSDGALNGFFVAMGHAISPIERNALLLG
jgi:hypothetical protein